MIYQAALRTEIHARTGLVFDTPDINGQAEIFGVTRELLKMWSKRTAQIDVEASTAIAEYELMSSTSRSTFKPVSRGKAPH